MMDFTQLADIKGDSRVAQERRKLGHSNLEVSSLCFGCNVFGWTADESTSFRLLDALVAAGLNFIDTADVYSKWATGNRGGESETTIGRWLKCTGKREKLVIATKAGMELAPDKKGLSKRYIFQAVEDSLRRLQTDYIDLYQAHIDDPETALDETLSAFAELLKQGKIRAIGASNYSAARLAEAIRVAEQNGLPRYASLQPEYNLVARAGFERELEPLCLEKGIGVIPYFSLASGFLTGKYRSENDLSKSPRGQKVKAYLNERGFRILFALDKVAKDKNSSAAQVALAWLMARPSVTAPIASATTTEQLSELIGATELKLDPTSIELLNWASEET
jgi:aryl-alcohol dehydrogenase-like predicted oxidoreductase